jgi:renal tumor antigen
MDFNFKQQIGTGIAVLIPPASEQAIDLITKQCTYNPDDRPSAKVILRHPYFKALRDDDKRKARMERVQQQAATSNYTTVQDTSDISNKRAVKEGISLPVSINKQPNGFLTTTMNPLLGKTAAAAELNKKHTLPKIPIAHQAALNNTNAHKIPNTKKFSTLPNINDDDKAKQPHHQTTKQLGYAQYTLPSLNRLRHGHPH